MPNLTIFTPTYNRAYTLPRLYDSLKRQSCKSFEWLIVDDGSTDNTRNLVSSFISENLIPIRYFHQANAGKSQAFNRGVALSHYELFACVDSDDYLDTDAVELILNQWEFAKQQQTCIGLLLGKRIYPGENPLTIVNKKHLPPNRLVTVYNAYASGLLKHDAWMIYQLDRLKTAPFPYFPGEKFVPEAYLYDKLDQLGSLFFVEASPYIAEYFPDGYTHNMESLNFNNANGYYAYVTQRLDIERKWLNCIIDIACYISICLVLDKSPIHPQYPFRSIALFPLGYLLYRKRYYRFKKAKNS